MQISEEELKQIVKEAVKEVLRSPLKGEQRECALDTVGITEDIHCQHHLYMKNFLEAQTIAKGAVLKAALTTIVTGALGLLWYGFWYSPKK